MKTMKKKGRIGSSFDDFLKEEGLYEEVTARAIKRVITRQLNSLIQEQGLTKSELAARMKTSRAQLDRLLDPANESVTLATLTRAAQAVGRNLRMELVHLSSDANGAQKEKGSRNKTGHSWMADVQFLLSECARFHEWLDRIGLKEFIRQVPKADTETLQLTNGGTLFCGAEALRRLYVMATDALQTSDAAGTIEPYKVYRSLKTLIVKRFIEEQRPVTPNELEAVLADAIYEAGELRSDLVHFVPCRLMYSKEPSVFTVGPVIFRSGGVFYEHMASHFAAYQNESQSIEHAQLAAKLLSDARHYYDDFTWIGEVKVVNCDWEISSERAHLAVTAALDVIHLLFGAYHTRLMAVGGSRLSGDMQARMYLDASGKFDISTSSRATSAVGFPDDWNGFLQREDVSYFLESAGKAIAPITDPTIDRPVGNRLVESAAWFGDAVREKSDAARVAKAVNALERLVIYDEERGITNLISKRGAALCYAQVGEESYGHIAESVRDAYIFRSKLVHGSLSPFDLEVKERAPSILNLVQRVLSAGFVFANEQGLLERSCTNEEIRHVLDNLVEWVQAQDRSSQGKIQPSERPHSAA
jgi:transcriptional regulator with XRE-family HTH domain